MESNDLLGKESVGKLLLKLAIPAVVAQLVNLLYNLVDRLYIAGLHIDAAFSGLTVCFPILMIVAAFSGLIGMGGAPLASIKLGENNKDEAEKILGNSFIMLIIISLVLSVVIFFARVPLLKLFGANEEIMPYALGYLNIYIVGTIFVQMSMGLNMFITAQGFAKTSMITVVVGAIANIILDPIFIFGLKMGVKGAALATILAQAISCVWVLAFLFGKKTTIKIKVKNFKLKAKCILPILALGISPFIMQATESLVQLTFNSSILKYSQTPEEATQWIAAMGILFIGMQIFSMILMGIAQGAQPIISYNYGAKNLPRVKATFKLLLITCVSVTAVFFVLYMAVPQVLAIPFATSDAVQKLAVHGMRIFLAGSFIFGVQTACQQTLVALGQSKTSLFLAILRKIILLIPLAMILPLFFNNKIDALLSAEPIADILAAIITFITFAITFKKLKAKMEKEAPPVVLATESATDTTINVNNDVDNFNVQQNTTTQEKTDDTNASEKADNN
ncbi:MAG: MATE family efflux transporter [Clostridia bacterium]